MITYPHWYGAGLALAAVFVALAPHSSSADTLCIRKKIKVIGGYVNLEGALKTYSKCPSTFMEVLDTDTFKGEDGSLRVYGDGSAGALTVSANSDLETVNSQYTNVTINYGVTLSVPSGTVIRCTGTFLNKGTIEVDNYAWGGTHPSTSGSTLTVAGASAHSGMSPGSASNGAFGTSTVPGGYSTTGMYGGANQARQILKPGPFGGGGGGAGGFIGGAGGGTITVLCKGGVTNDGKIDVRGGKSLFNFGDGGGGGGIVILASKTSVTQTASGTIDARGGDGTDSYEAAAAGGGGGGGWSHFIAPSISASGKFLLTGGFGGDGVGGLTSTRRFGGGSGGSGYGAGGYGGSVTASNVAGDGGKGSTGNSFQTQADPTSLF